MTYKLVINSAACALFVGNMCFDISFSTLLHCGDSIHSYIASNEINENKSLLEGFRKSGLCSNCYPGCNIILTAAKWC
jgi:hypothetical protein